MRFGMYGKDGGTGHKAIAVLLLVCAGAVSRADALPEFVDWSLDAAWQRDNGLRGEISLNGWWRWRAAAEEDAVPPSEGWRFRKVPGQGPAFAIRDEAGEDLTRSRPVQIDAETRDGNCWVEREFRVPLAWREREVRLVLDSVQGEGEVFLDGDRLGSTWPFLVHEIPLADAQKEGVRRVSIRSGGLIHNVRLVSNEPGPAEVNDTYLMTSVREMAATIRASGRGAADSLRVVITTYAEPRREVKRAGPFAVAVGEDGWSLEAHFAWPEAELWSLDHPDLYAYHLELLDAEGGTIDRTFPIRFGFRELWIEKGRFMLNRRPITLNMDIHTPLATRIRNFGRFADEDTWREIIRQWKRLGVNTAIHRWSQATDDSALYRIADEEGFFISTDIFGFQYGMPEANRLPEIREYKQAINEYRLLYRRHCPSLAFYYLPGTANTWDFEPRKLGEDYDTEKRFGRHNRPERAFVEAFDPARIAFAGSGGGESEPVHSTMNYISIDADLQVHETWPSHWYRNRTKPLATYEMAAPSYIANWFMRRDRGEQAHGRRGNLPFWMEVGAITLGEAPYKNEPREAIRQWLSAVREEGYNRQSEWTYAAVSELFVRNVYRAWRTYGVNMGFFTQIGKYVGAPAALFQAPAEADPRRPGPTPDYDLRGAPNVIRPGELSEIGRVAQSALREWVVYLGGADGEFTNKDHTWFSGEDVRKAVVMMNNFDDPVTVNAAWKLSGPDGAEVKQGTLDEEILAPGEIAPARSHVVFRAPVVADRTEFILSLRAEAGALGFIEDRFEITVFPPPEPPATNPEVEITLYDPIGETRALLQKTGVPFQEVAGTLPDPGDLLIVGRNALKDASHRREFGALLYRKMGYDFGINVRNGMRVLVFEQALDNLWGLKTEQARWRRAFNVAPGHPVFEGLGEGDFLYLKGDANLVDPYPPAAPGRVARVATDRFPQWGNDNSVVTYSLIRPQLGAARALIACGFDLREAALLEVAAGRGRLMFCQVDVSNRYGVDPVSTRLVNNLLAYMTTVDAPDPGIGEPVDLVRRGWDEYDVEIEQESDIFFFDLPDGRISWGITAAESYFQGFLDLPVLRGPGGEKFLYGRLPGENRVGHLLNRRGFDTDWQKMKAMQMLAALRINQGGSSDICPHPGLRDDGEELYPLEWLQGFVHPYLFMNW